MNIELLLTGGHPNSLGHTEEVIHFVFENPGELKTLFDCLFVSDELVRMRAGDALEKICRVHPDWFSDYIDRLQTEVYKIDQPSVQWHLVQMMGELDLNEIQTKRAIEILRSNLEHATDWIVLNFSIEIMYKFVKENTSLATDYSKQLKRLMSDPHKSVSKRAQKYLNELAK